MDAATLVATSALRFGWCLCFFTATSDLLPPLRKDMESVKGMWRGLALKLIYLELKVLTAAHLCHFLSFGHLKYAVIPSLFASVGWGASVHGLGPAALTYVPSVGSARGSMKLNKQSVLCAHTFVYVLLFIHLSAGLEFWCLPSSRCYA